MSFIDNVEKEYEELFEEPANGDVEKESTTMEEGMDDIMSDIKSDLKNVPKEDVWPVFPGEKKKGKDDSASEAEDGDIEEARRMVLPRKKRNKGCKINGKTYEIGERWKDEKTGRNMICILVNVPKELQPKLAETDLILTQDDPEEKKEELLDDQQWSYTAQPKEPPCKPLVEEKKQDKSKPTFNKTRTKEDIKTAEKDEDEEISAINKKSTTEETEDTENKDTKIPEIVLVDSPTRKDVAEEQVEENEETESEVDENFVGDKPTVERETDDEPQTESEAEKENEDVQAEKSHNNGNELKGEVHDETAIPKDVDQTTKSLNDENTNKEDTKREEEVEVTESADESSPPQPADKAEKTEEIESVDTKPNQEEGQKLYTKETTVIRRKLFKTEETMETTETEKNI